MSMPLNICRQALSKAKADGLKSIISSRFYSVRLHLSTIEVDRRSNQNIRNERVFRNHSLMQKNRLCTEGGWNSRVKTEFEGVTPIDIEKSLFKIKRRMGMFHSKGTRNVLRINLTSHTECFYSFMIHYSAWN